MCSGKVCICMMLVRCSVLASVLLMARRQQYPGFRRCCVGWFLGGMGVGGVIKMWVGENNYYCFRNWRMPSRCKDTRPLRENQCNLCTNILHSRKNGDARPDLEAGGKCAASLYATCFFLIVFFFSSRGSANQSSPAARCPLRSSRSSADDYICMIWYHSGNCIKRCIIAPHKIVKPA